MSAKVMFYKVNEKGQRVTVVEPRTAVGAVGMITPPTVNYSRGMFPFVRPDESWDGCARSTTGTPHAR